MVGVAQSIMKCSYSKRVLWKHFSMKIKSCLPRVLVQEINEGRIEARALAMRSVLLAEKRRWRKAVKLWKPVV